jgi:hypothetical protein
MDQLYDFASHIYAGTEWIKSHIISNDDADL